MLDKIKERILEVIPDATVMVGDPRNDGVHLEAFVISESFVGQSLVKQHQTVMNALKEEFKDELHALALKTFTPEKWDAFQTAKQNSL